jgi:hypothetical protein
MPASYAISVRRAEVLPAASFGFRVAPDTLAVRLTVPTIRVRKALAPPYHESATMTDSMALVRHAPCRAHQKKGPLPGGKKATPKLGSVTVVKGVHPQTTHDFQLKK